MIDPLGTYVAPFKPLNNITPFTYRDGLSYLEVLEDMRDYVNNTLVAYVNDNFNELGDEFETQVNVLITQVNAAIDAVINSSIEAQDSVVEGIFQDEDSATFIYTMTLFASKAIETIVTSGRLSDANLIAQFAVKSIETIVTSGRLSDASLIAEFAVKSVETIVTSGRLSDENLNLEFAAKAVETMTASGRLSVASLDAAYALKSVETIVTSGRLSVASLDTAYIDPVELAKYAINQFSTVALLLASTPAGGNQVYASALNAPGALFRYDTSWKMYGEAVFADSTARDAALTAPVVNMRCYLTTPKMHMEYNGTAWHKIGVLRPSAAVVSAGAGSSVINDDGSVTVTFTGAGNVIISNCIAPIALTDINDLDLTWTGSASGIVTMKQATGGVVDPVTTGYDTNGLRILFDGTTAALTAINTSSWTINGPGGVTSEIELEIRGALNPAKGTVILNNGRTLITAGTNDNRIVESHFNRALTAFDGMQIAVAGAGTIVVKFRPRV